jgi:hypothetical protein
MMAETMTKNELVQKIHNDFMTAETFIKNNELIDFNLSKINESQKISKFGFTNKENILRKDAEINQMTKDLIEILPNYQEIFDNLNAKYPFFKAITEEQVQILCKKYNLFLSDTKNFIGNIPNKNILDMEKFEEHFYPEDSLTIKYFENYILKYNDEDFKKWLDFEKDKYRIHFTINNTHDQNWGHTSSHKWSIYEFLSNFSWQYDLRLLDDYFSTSYTYNQGMQHLKNLFLRQVGSAIPKSVKKDMNYQIIAPLSDFSFDEKDYKINLKTNKIENFESEVNKEEITFNITVPAAPDPIVLMPINLNNFTDKPIEDKKMYLIVTAWGIEAQDELVINHKLN